MKKIKVFFTVLALTLSALAFAQNVTVTGVVTDAQSGDPVPFASLSVKGTMTGANTDADGTYSITVPSNASLVFSSVGYTSYEVAVGNRSVINVALEPDTVLDDVLVVAYGTATKSSFTGSATMVKSEQIEAHVSSSVTGALAGTTPGVQVLSSTGDPASGGSKTIRIRGIGSMSASSAPLVILDGMPYDGSISDINPNDVESMSVLKDAAASAIYGARGANGVILITTKRATSSDAQIKFDAKWGSNSRLIPQYDVITDPAQYCELFYKRMYNSQIYAGKSVAEAYAYADKNFLDANNGGLGYQVFTVPAGEKLIGTNFKLNPNATPGYYDGEYYYQADDWYNEVFHNSFRQEYNLSVAGAGDRFSYYASAGYLKDGGIVNNSDYSRITTRLNAEYQAKSWLKFLTNMSFSHSDSQSNPYNGTWGSSGNLFYYCNNMGPVYPLYVRGLDEDGNPYIMTNEVGMTMYDTSGNTNFKRANFIGNAVRDNEYNSNHNSANVVTGKWGVVLTPVKGLSLTATLGMLSDDTRYNALYSRYGSAASVDGSIYVSHSRYFTLNQQYIADYKTDFGGSDHNFDIMVGYEQYRTKSSSLSGSNDHIYDPNIPELNNADGLDNRSLSSATSNYLTLGIIGRLQYDYAGKYFISGSYRRDASSRWAQGHRWGDFGSVGLAWLISKEGFMRDASWVDMLKIKASYGVQGNDAFSSLFPYSDQYTHSYDNATSEYSATLVYKGNPDITWESSHSINAGVDFELFGGWLNGSIEGFSKITSDLLYNKPVPMSSGNPTGYYAMNIGSISNKGVEVTLDGHFIKTKRVQWDWNINFSHYKNTILDLDPDVRENGIKGSNYIYEVGGSLYQAYMYQFAGVDQNTGKALWYYDEKTTAEDGTEIVTKSTTDVFSKASQYDCGSVLPKLYGGFGTTLKAFGFDFTAQFSYQLGGKYYDGTYQTLMWSQNSAGMAWHKDALKAWGEPGAPANTNIPRLDGSVEVGQSACDCYLISSNYLSLNNVSLGYTFPAKWTRKIKIAGLRVYFAGENLAVLSARKGVDPRYSMGIGSYTSGSGINSSSYSAMRNVTGGLTLTF